MRNAEVGSSILPWSKIFAVVHNPGKFVFCIEFVTYVLCAKVSLPGGLEPPTFRLTAERAAYCATEAPASTLNPFILIFLRNTNEVREGAFS